MTITRRRWFDLARHDDPEPTPEGDPDPGTPEGDPEGDNPTPDPEGADKLGDAGKKALDRMKAERAEARKAAAAEKKRADELAKKVAEFEDRDKSDLEKAQAAAERAAEIAAKATLRAVTAEVKAAAGDFADPEDAVAFLQSKISEYGVDAGDIDTEAIAADLADLLERKPHLRKRESAPEQPKQPKPDPSQGPRPTTPPTDWRTADRDAFKGELAKYGVRLRS